jgi:hypothetical protein
VPKPISRKQGASTGCAAPLFGGIFFIIGVALFYFLSGQPLYLYLASQSWNEVPCQIVSSEVGDHGDTYSVDITYTYEAGGQVHTSSRYNFFVGSTSGVASKQAIVDRYPAGSSAVCFVNPKNADEAVLTREFTWGYALGGIGFIFIAVGIAAGRAISRQSARRAVPQPVSEEFIVQSSRGVENSSGVIRTAGRARNRFIGITIFAVLWNGITWTIWYFVAGADSGGLGWGGTIFFGLFQLVGLLLIAGVFHSFLGMFNPTMELILEPPSIRLAESMTISWAFQGRTDRIVKFTIELEGTEKATYRRGTDTHTDTHVFRVIPIYESQDRGMIREGSVPFTMPEFTMHTFTAGRNEIIWTLKVRGTINNWPDISEEFTVNVLPLALHPAIGGDVNATN